MKKLLTLVVLIFLIGTGFTTAQLSDNKSSYLLEVNPDTYDRSILEELGVEIKYEYDIVNYVAVEASETTISQVESQDPVKDIENDLPTFLPVREGNGDDSDRGNTEGGDGTVIAVLDTGIDDSHADLEGEVREHKDFTGSGPNDRHGHGTHVASIAAGKGEATPEYRGVAPEAKLMNVKVMDDSGQGQMSDAIKGIDYAVNNGADIIVMSLGAETECDGSDPLSRAADNAVEEGVSVVVSAGNNGPDSRTITAPGCGHKVFTVGASHREESVPDFSSRGPTADDRLKPDVVAEGVNIMAAEAGTQSSYTSKSGTSMSAPYVAGGVAILQDQEPDKTPSEYFQAFSETTFTLDESRYAEGQGNVNVTAAENKMSGKSSQDDSGSGQTGDSKDEDSSGDQTNDDTEQNDSGSSSGSDNTNDSNEGDQNQEEDSNSGDETGGNQDTGNQNDEETIKQPAGPEDNKKAGEKKGILSNILNFLKNLAELM